MTFGNKKLKIQTNKKSYFLEDSPFYQLSSKKRLASILLTDIESLKMLGSDSNYRVFIEQGISKSREIQQPYPRLDLLHTRISSLLCRIKTPDYLHSGLKGRTYIINAKEHVGDHPLLTADLRSFFTSTLSRHVFRFFHLRMKCAPDIARILTDISTYNGHVPTGSRLSMPIAYWANSELFDDLYKLSNKYLLKMTVYVDDITFSGNGISRKFLFLVKKIVSSHNHELHPEKIKLYRSNSVKLVTGVAIRGAEIIVRNKRHQDIYQDLVQWIVSRVEYPTHTLNDRLLGRLNAQGQIDRRYKDKARTLRSEMKKSSF